MGRGRRGGRSRGAGAARPGKRALPLDGAAGAVLEHSEACPDLQAARRARPRSGITAEPRRGEHSILDDPERDRVRTPRSALFLAVALESDDGRSWLAFALFAFIAWTGGMVARITGQYSRLGAAPRPAHRPPPGARRSDRGVALRAAPALGARPARGPGGVHAATFTQVALRRGIDLNVNMVGRWAVWPVMSALGLALVWDSWVPESTALPRHRPDPCGHRAVSARWGAGPARRLNLAEESL